MTYLDVSARRPLPAASCRAAEAMLLAQATGTVPKPAWFAMADSGEERRRRRCSPSIPATLAFTKNASEGLNAVGAALAAAAGRPHRHQSRHRASEQRLPWLWQAETAGAELVSAKPAQGRGHRGRHHRDARTAALGWWRSPRSTS